MDTYVMTKWFIDFLKTYKKEKEAEGLIPTVGLLIEELEDKQKI